jgi:ABC-type phosphate/phosphonate transport system substrate-binding protein
MRFARFKPGWFLVLLLPLLTPVASQAELILGSAPRDSRQNEEEIYQPIAALLTQATGEKVTFRHGDNFLVYQSEMRKGTYDIVFDSPAFVGWRMAKLEHVPLVKFPGKLVFAVITKKDNDKVRALSDLAGRTICAFPPPNLATLTVLYEFDNPARQPLIIETQSFPAAYQNLLAGKCTAAITQVKLFQDMDKEARAAKVVFTSQPLPNQAFSAGPRVTADKRDKIARALLSPEGAIATQKLRTLFKIQHLLPATVDEYRGLGRLLRDVWGFEQ